MKEKIVDNSARLFGDDKPKPKLKLVKKKWTEVDLFPPEVTELPETDLSKITDPKGKELADQIRARDKSIRETRLPPKGVLRLSPHLDKRRLQFGIPHTAFRVQALFERILVFQIRDENRETFVKGGTILTPGTNKRANEQKSARAIIVSAGVGAMDTLTAHGCQIGDIIHFTRLSPFRDWFDNIEFEDQYLITLHVGDITANEDLRQRLWRKEVLIRPVTNERGETEHRFVDAEGKIWKSSSPWQPGDY